MLIMSDRSLGELVIRIEHCWRFIPDQVISPIVLQIQEGLDKLHWIKISSVLLLSSLCCHHLYNTTIQPRDIHIMS
jgi:hypothetical protein